MIDPATPLTVGNLRTAAHISGTGTTEEQPAPPAGASGRAYIPPRTAVEQALAQLWADVLQLPHVGVEDSFFALGGDSITAIQLLDGVERRLGARLPVTLLFSDATVAQMAEALTAHMAGIDVDPILLPINRSGEGAPFFYAHGVFGDVSSLTNLVPLLPADQPLYGLQAIGLHPDYAPDETLEAMAAHYVEAIQGVQPRGPYRLGGFCFGGVLAYETARQLEARGEQIALLAIIEGSAPRKFHQPRSLFDPARLAVARQSIPQLLRGNEEFGGWRVRQRLARRLRGASGRQKTGGGRDAWEVEFDNLGDYNAARPPIQHRLKEINVAAIRDYHPQPINARVTLFRARYLPLKHTFLSPIDPERGWGALARGGVDIRYVDGSHIGVLRQPHAQDLARALAQTLADKG